MRRRRRALTQVADERFQGCLVAVVDLASRSKPFDQGDAGERRIARELLEESIDRSLHPSRPILRLDLVAGGSHALPHLLDRQVVGGDEALVLALEVLVEITLRDGRPLTDHRHRRFLVPDLVQRLGQTGNQAFALIACDKLRREPVASPW